MIELSSAWLKHEISIKKASNTYYIWISQNAKLSKQYAGSIGLMSGGRTRGRRIECMAEAYPELQALLRVHIKSGKTGCCTVQISIN